MTERVILCLSQDEIHAGRILECLLRTGFSSAAISMLLPDKRKTPEYAYAKEVESREDPTELSINAIPWRAAFGSIKTIAIPGLGTLTGVGSRMTALRGVGNGETPDGLVTALLSIGTPEYEAKHYEESLRRGRVLILLETENFDHARKVKNILEEAHARGIALICDGPCSSKSV